MIATPTALAPLDANEALAARVELPADRHPVLVYLARLAPGSRRTMRAALEGIARLVSDGRADALALDWSQLRYQHTAAIRSRLAEAYAPATANKALAALRGVLREAWRLGLVAADAYQRATDLEPVRGERPLRGRAIDAGEVRALVAVCRECDSPLGARDAAMLGVLYACGLRRSELVALDLDDHDSETGALEIRHGKGGRARTVYVTNGAGRALAAWRTVRGTAAGPMFYRGRKGGLLVPERMSPQAVLDVLRRRSAAAKVKPCSPHDWRRTFVGELLDGGADLATVRALAGHADPATTARYDRRGERAKARAATLLHFPY
jgi:site-specific recombinase XerD